MQGRAVYLVTGLRTPIGRYGGALAKLRADDLAAAPLRALVAALPGLDWEMIDEVIYGCANQAGEDNRNVARMALLLAGLPERTPGLTVNRLCASGLDAAIAGARAIAAGEADLVVAGGVESMTRAPFVHGKADSAFSRNAEIYDTTIGWRFVNPAMKKAYGVDSMPETAENVATDFQITWPSASACRVPTRTPSPCAASTAPAPSRPAAGSTARSPRSPSPTAKAISWSAATSTPAPTPRSKP